MFGYVKNILRKWVESPEAPQPAPPANTAAAPARQIVMTPPRTGTPAPTNGGHQSGRGVELPLQSILSALPLELQPRLRQRDAGELTISIPLEKVLVQLSRGVVKITFGELRQAAPDFFTPDTDRDSILVPLPMGEILTRLNPALITRRRVQRHVEVPAEISSPFDPRSQGLIYSIGPTKPESAPAPAPRHIAPPTPAMVPPARNGITFAPTPPPPAATPAPIPAPAMDFAPRPARELPSSPPPAAVAPAPPPKPASDSNPLLVNLTSLAEAWPEAVRQELVQLNLVDAKVALPAEVVERALKQGRVAFTWKTLRSWIKPTPRQGPSAHDSLVLELPLKVVAPPFLARQKEVGRLQKKVMVDDEIPNLFFGFPRPEANGPGMPSNAGQTSARPSDTNFYVWDDTHDQARIEEDDSKRSPSPGTKFVAKYATPNEVVSRAAALDGVAGVLIALPDGLMVASRIAADLNGDTLAAFLPQIFGKVNQCTKELRMGELNNVNFTVGNIPWKIFRVNAIFFAAFGRVGEPLPTAQLAALAAELDHRAK
jgi:predicted regulator of Ras-like GTPase activity (Roadblock/LC7/MglB family)